MKLTTGLIFDSLREQFDIRYTRSSNRNTVVGRPLFYDDSSSCQGHICILPHGDMCPEKLNSGAYISIGELPADISMPNIELLTISETVTANILLNALQSLFDYYDDWEAELVKIAG